MSRCNVGKGCGNPSTAAPPSAERPERRANAGMSAPWAAQQVRLLRSELGQPTDEASVRAEVEEHVAINDSFKTLAKRHKRVFQSLKVRESESVR